MSGMLHFDPHPKQQEVLNDDHRYKALNWGRRVGKTYFLVMFVLLMALKKQGRYWIVLPTYNQAKKIYWKPYIEPLIYRGFAQSNPDVAKINEQELSVTLSTNLAINLNGVIYEHDPSLPPSTIELIGSDMANVRGAGLDGIVFDEYAYHKPEKWELVFEPMLLTTLGWAIFASTPNGFDHWYELCMNAQKDPDWFYSHATGYDNPHIPKDELEKLRKKRGEDVFAQEYLAEFRRMKGLVYKEFNHEVHIIQPDDIPTVGTYYMSIDFGFTNPTAVVFVMKDYDENWYVYDEVYERELTMDKLYQILKDKMGDKQFTLIGGDSAQAEHIATLQQKGIPIVPVSKTSNESIQAGIRKVKELLRVREQLEGKPKPKLYVSSTCQNFIKEMDGYVYMQGSTELNEKEIPVKKNDHLMDAIRYLFMVLEQIEGAQHNTYANFKRPDLS